MAVAFQWGRPKRGLWGGAHATYQRQLPRPHAEGIFFCAGRSKRLLQLHAKRAIHATSCMFGIGSQQRVRAHQCLVGRWPMMSPEAVSGRYARPA
eukprot:7148989-Prymnesium_polylepis.1